MPKLSRAALKGLALAKLHGRPTSAPRHVTVHCASPRTGDGARMETRMPSKRALAVLDEPPPTEPLSTRRISKKVRAAIDALVNGNCRTVAEAAEKGGMARESLSRALS